MTKLKKASISSIVILLLVIGGTIISFATSLDIQKGSTIKLTKEENVYIRPLINSKVISNLEKDTTITVNTVINGWAYINNDLAKGWIRVDNAQVHNESENQENITENTNNENNSNQTESNNEQAENNNEQTENNASENTTEETKPLNKTAYISTSGINFRAEPNTDSKVLKVFAQNAKITILAEEGDWYKIEHKDQVGYVVKTYVSEKKVKEETTSRSGADRTQTATITTQQVATQTSAETVKTENTAVSNTTENNTVKEETTNSSNKGQEVANYVKQFVGCKYVYGGASTKGFDCSGLTLYVYKNFGVSLPHSATAQSKLGTKIAKADLQPGDLIFFKNYRTNKGIGHVGIYIGNNKFVHASTEKTGVITSTLTGSYNTRFVTATRMF